MTNNQEKLNTGEDDHNFSSEKDFDDLFMNMGSHGYEFDGDFVNVATNCNPYFVVLKV